MLLIMQFLEKKEASSVLKELALIVLFNERVLLNYFFSTPKSSTLKINVEKGLMVPWFLVP